MRPGKLSKKKKKVTDYKVTSTELNCPALCRAFFIGHFAILQKNEFQGMPEYFKIGKIVSAFGLEGETILLHSLGKKTSLKGIEAIFIEERKASFLPYFVQSARIKSEKETYLKLEDIISRDASLKIVQKEVWMEEKDFKQFAARSAPIALLGYHLIDKGEAIGVIAEIIEQPHQVLCKILLEGKEVLIPLHEQTLQSVDNKNKKVFVDLPDGLLEIYKSS